jgi:hypothetical protein
MSEKVPQAAAGHEDEADALKAMFQATEDHWKETNAKMSTLVSRYGVSPLPCIEQSSHERVFAFFASLHSSFGILPSSFRKVEAPRFPGSLRNKPQHQHSYQPYQQPHRQSDRPLPASYVCYRCGQKGTSTQPSVGFSLIASCRFIQVIGSRIVQQTTTASGTTNPASSAPPGSHEVS